MMHTLKTNEKLENLSREREDIKKIKRNFRKKKLTWKIYQTVNYVSSWQDKHT